jgi:hypothetical protein
MSDFVGNSESLACFRVIRVHRNHGTAILPLALYQTRQLVWQSHLVFHSDTQNILCE